MDKSKKKRDFFISYNGADRSWAEWIAWHLEEANYSTILQAWDFRPSSNFVLEMHKAAVETERTIAVLSPAYLSSLFTQPEWAAAFVQDSTSSNGKLLPIRVQECELEGLLKAIVYIDLVGLKEEDAKKVLLEGVKTCITKVRAKPDQAPAFPVAIKKQPRFPGSLPPYWNVPHNRNPNFTGREEYLAELEKKLASGSPTAITQAISGLGGIGKTQLAIEYIYRHTSQYNIVWWIRAEEPETLADDYAALADSLPLPECTSTEQRKKVEAVKKWLGRNTKWLIVFDNVTEPKDVQEYLPQGSTGHIIITSRSPKWRKVASQFQIDTWRRPESVEFLLKRTGLGASEAAGQIAEELGDLPLALEQAGAYIEETSSSFAKYLELCRTRRKELSAIEHPPKDYDATVMTTWSLAMDNIRTEAPAAAGLLNLFAYLGSDDIPQDLLTKGVEHLPASHMSAVSDTIQMDQSIAALKRYSLIKVENDAFSIHRLVQAVIRDRMSEDEQKQWCETTLHIVNSEFSFDSNDVRTWGRCSQLLPHAAAAAGHAEKFNVAPEALGQLLNKAGLYLSEKAEFAQAKGFHKRALIIAESTYGSDHPTVAIRVNNLGGILRDLGDLKGAKEHFERALIIDEKTYGPDHPTVAIRVNNLGSVLHDLGDLKGAKEHFERALIIGEKTYGPDHPTVAIRVSNLGGVLRDLGDLKGAKEHFERALIIDEKTYGPDHPTVAIRVNNLGLVLQEMGDLKGAKEHYERALAIGEKTYGPDHPTVAIDVNNLGLVLQEMGDLKGAKKHYERALAIGEKTYGPDHPTVAIRVSNLGTVLRDLGDLKGAKAHLERALAIDEKTYGPYHPAVAGDVNNLGMVLQDLGDLKGAKEHYERALAIFTKYLGKDHPSTKTVKSNLASIK